jgi:hypothetical protein
MIKRFVPSVAIAILLILTPATLGAEYSRWSVFGGFDLIYNTDGEGVTTIPGMQANGDPGGYTSAPSPLATFLGTEYRYSLPIQRPIDFAPSASIYGVQYLWANDRPLPAEIENRTSYVGSIFLDMPFLYHIEKNRFMFSFGAGPGILARCGFLESGVPSDAKNPGETLNAGEQVKAINEYFWQSGRWFYPTLQTGVRYQLDTGWGAGLTLRLALPMANLWSTPKVPFNDSMMIIAALVITPPVRKPATAADAPSADATPAADTAPVATGPAAADKTVTAGTGSNDATAATGQATAK